MRTSVYNLIANLCSFVLRSEPRDYLVRYSCISHGERRRIEGKIRGSLPALFGENLLTSEKAGNSFFRKDSGKIRREAGFLNDGQHSQSADDKTVDTSETGQISLPYGASGLSQNFLDQLTQFTERLEEEKDCNTIMRLLQILDEALHPVLVDGLAKMTSAAELKTLNSNRESTGIELYPRCHCVWARKSRQYFSERRIDNYLQYLVVVEKGRIGGITAHHIFIPKGFFPAFDKCGEMTVAASPVSAETDFTIQFHRSQEFQSFTLDYADSDGAFFTNLVWDKIRQAGRNGAEIVVFPEMLGTPEMEAAVRERLRGLAAEERADIPPMIILPTVFVDRQNYASILDREGNRIAVQFKQNPYVMECDDGTYMEDISGSNEVIVFHYPGIGRFAVMICKDFLTTRYMERIMRGFKLTMIIVPAYSTGAYDFRTSFETCAHDYCNVVWINSCAAMAPGKEQNFRYIGYVRKRITRDQNPEDAFREMTPCEGLLSGQCGHDCLYVEKFGKVYS